MSPSPSRSMVGSPSARPGPSSMPTPPGVNWRDEVVPAVQRRRLLPRRRGRVSQDCPDSAALRQPTWSPAGVGLKRTLEEKPALRNGVGRISQRMRKVVQATDTAPSSSRCRSKVSWRRIAVDPHRLGDLGAGSEPDRPCSWSGTNPEASWVCWQIPRRRGSRGVSCAGGCVRVSDACCHPQDLEQLGGQLPVDVYQPTPQCRLDGGLGGL